MESQLADAQNFRGPVDMNLRTMASLILLLIMTGCASVGEEEHVTPKTLRVMTFNLEDVRTEDLSRMDHPRLKSAAATIQELRPDILLLNEIACLF